jgi:hypothetical protein
MQDNNLLDMVVKKYGYRPENITFSDVPIKSTEHYQELYKSSKGSQSDFEKGWCLFYTDGYQRVGTLHRVNKGVVFMTLAMQIAVEKYTTKKN